MSTFISAKLIVGLPYKELEEVLRNMVPKGYVDIVDVIEDNFEYACPSYDAPMEDWIIGYDMEIPTRELETLEEVFGDRFEQLQSRFKDKLGLSPRAIITPHVI